MCKCIEEWEQRLKNEYIPRHPDKNFTGVVIPTSVRTVNHKGKRTRVVVAQAILPWTTEGGRHRNHGVLAVPTYCCFCGTKIDYESKIE